MPSAIPMRGLRMPDELYLKLKAISERENRSYNQEAIYILKNFVEDYEKKNGIIKVDVHELYK